MKKLKQRKKEKKNDLTINLIYFTTKCLLNSSIIIKKKADYKNKSNIQIGSNIMIYIFLSALGLIVGALSGMFGIGGGIIVLPALVFLCGFSQKMANGTTIAMLLPPIGILAFIQYYKNNFVHVPAAIILILGFLAGSHFGAKYALGLDEVLLKRGFGILLITIGIIYLLKASNN